MQGITRIFFYGDNIVAHMLRFLAFPYDKSKKNKAQRYKNDITNKTSLQNEKFS